MVAALDGRTVVRHAWLTFSGTWAAPGTGYCSWVLQAANSDLVYEVPVQSPWSFGFVGGAPGGASYRQSVNIGVEWAITWLLAHPLQTFGLAGYSQGGEAASRVLWEVINPGGRLYHLRPNYIGSFTLGNPCRQAGHTFPGGADPGGSGISTFNLTNTPPEHVDEANHGDLYTTTPDDGAGVFIRDMYELGIDLQMNDPIGFFVSMLSHLLKVMQDAGGILPIGLLGGLGGGAGLTMIPGLLLGTFGGLLGGIGGGGAGGLGGLGGLLGGLTGGGGLGGLGGLLGGTTPAPTAPAAPMSPTAIDAVRAAILGLTFMASGTGPHITYESTPATPGITHLDHARYHVNARSAAIPATAAA